MKKVLLTILLIAVTASMCACNETSTFDSDESEYLDVSDETNDEVEIENSQLNVQKISGLVLCDCDYDILAKKNDFRLFTVNPETGEEKTIHTFDAGKWGVMYHFPHGGIDRHAFSEDFNNLAGSIEIEKSAGSYSIHAGWIDQDNNFVDVTELLGLDPSGDFSKRVNYGSVGFSDDGYFVYYDIDKGDKDESYFSVPVNDLSPEKIENRNAIKKDIEIQNKDLIPCARITSWIDDHRCLCEDWRFDYRSELLDFSKQSITNYIYGTDTSNSRICTNGVVSPDKKSAAFLSYFSQIKVEIYTSIIDDPNSQPQKVNLGRMLVTTSPFPKNEICQTYLLDWK